MRVHKFYRTNWYIHGNSKRHFNALYIYINLTPKTKTPRGFLSITQKHRLGNSHRWYSGNALVISNCTHFFNKLKTLFTLNKFKIRFKKVTQLRFCVPATLAAVWFPLRSRGAPRAHSSIQQLYLCARTRDKSGRDVLSMRIEIHTYTHHHTLSRTHTHIWVQKHILSASDFLSRAADATQDAAHIVSLFLTFFTTTCCNTCWLTVPKKNMLRSQTSWNIKRA